MNHPLSQFFVFLINNYYSPLTFDEFAGILEEWFDSNPDLAESFGNGIGGQLAEDILDIVDPNDKNEECYVHLEALQDYFHIVYDYAISRAHYEYLVEFFANDINSKLKTK